MKSVAPVVIFAGALLVGAIPIAAQVTPSATGSVFTDLIKKGKNDLDNFDYAAAGAVWNQLLLQQLSRQQRIDVLQLKAATFFPNDPDAQKRDSATMVIQQLVGMGARRMFVKDVSHPGLDSLYTSVVASAGPSAAPVAFDSVRNVVALVTDGYQLDEIADRVTIDCYSFAFEELELALRGRRALATALPTALKRTCSQLNIESDPPNGNLTVGNRDFGNVPERGQWRWIMPERAVEVAIAKGQSRASKVVEFPQGKLVQARFFLPKDTILWPSVKTPQQIADELRIFDNYRPSTPAPVQPARPRGMGALAAGSLWGLVGAVGGLAVGQFVSAAGCNVMDEVPAGRTARVKGKTYNAGEDVQLGGGMPCIATLAGGTFAGVFTFTAIIKGSKNRSATARYNEATRNYPTVRKEWDDRERTKFANNNPDVRQAVADQQIKLQQTQAENSNIRARNSNLPQPEITLRDLNLSATSSAAPAGSAPPTEMSSDVDARVPSADAPNPNAVAIVIGNRDYQVAGVPKADHAIRDAKSMKRYLVEAFGFSEDRVVLDTNVSVGRMNELFGSATDASGRLADLVNGRTANAVDVFVFYSGHGGPEGRPAKRYLVPVDANPRRLGATGYALDVLYKNLTALKARSVTVAIDAGFGSLSEAGSLMSNQSFGGSIELEVGTVGGANTQVLLAGTGEQTAKWRRDQGHGLFTYFFLKGIQGSADANGDRNITAGELETYVKSNVRSYAADRMMGAQQSPEVFTNNPSRIVVTSKGGT